MKENLKIFAIISFVLSAICVFVAIERYNSNANNVKAMNAMQNNFSNQTKRISMNSMSGNVKPTPLTPVIREFGNVKLTPATPAATKYAILFAIVFGGAGAAFLYKGKQKDS